MKTTHISFTQQHPLVQNVQPRTPKTLILYGSRQAAPVQNKRFWRTYIENQATVQDAPFKVNAVGAPFVPVQEPLKPGAELRVAPAGITLLYAALVIVTALPLWVKVPFHPCVIV